MKSTPNASPANSSPNSKPPETGFFPVLKNPNFLCLWSGQVFSQLADKVFLVLAIAIVSAQFKPPDQSISLWVSAITIAFTIPAVLFGFVAGVFVDRVSKKSVLVASNLARGLLILVIPFLLSGYSGQFLYNIPLGFYALLGITFLVSTFTQFFAPAEQSAIPFIVKERHLLPANSLYTTTMMAAAILGFAVGEPVLEIADGTLANWGIGKEAAVGSFYIIAGLILLALRTRETSATRSVKVRPIGQELRDGWAFLQRKPRVRAALVQLILLFSLMAALTVLAVRMAELIPTLEADRFGFLLAAAGVGLAIGAALVGQLGHRFSYRHLSLFGSAGLTATLVGLSLFYDRLPFALTLIAILGAFAACVGIPMQTTIQKETPDEMLGKVFGLQNNAVNIALSLPLALAGLAETYLGLRLVLVLLATAALTSGFATWYISRKQAHRSPTKS